MRKLKYHEKSVKSLKKGKKKRKEKACIKNIMTNKGINPTYM